MNGVGGNGGRVWNFSGVNGGHQNYRLKRCEQRPFSPEYHLPFRGVSYEDIGFRLLLPIVESSLSSSAAVALGEQENFEAPREGLQGRSISPRQAAIPSHLCRDTSTVLLHPRAGVSRSVSCKTCGSSEVEGQYAFGVGNIVTGSDTLFGQGSAVDDMSIWQQTSRCETYDDHLSRVRIFMTIRKESCWIRRDRCESISPASLFRRTILHRTHGETL